MGGKLIHFVIIALLLLVKNGFCQSFLHKLSKDFSLSHNSCTRKLLCLIGSSESSSQYEHIVSGLNYFYSGMPDSEPFVTDKQFMVDAWNWGLKSTNNNETCETLETAKNCDLPIEEIMKSFSDVYKKDDILSRPKRTSMSSIMGRVRKIKFMGRPLLRPEHSTDRAVCQRCEKKRTDCFNYYMGTYGLCGAAWIVAGVIGTATCNILTWPRTIDCTVNAWFNCHQHDCGFVGF